MGSSTPVATQAEAEKRVYSVANGDISTQCRHGRITRVANGMLIADRLSGGRKDLVRNGLVS